MHDPVEEISGGELGARGIWSDVCQSASYLLLVLARQLPSTQSSQYLVLYLQRMLGNLLSAIYPAVLLKSLWFKPRPQKDFYHFNVFISKLTRHNIYAFVLWEGNEFKLWQRVWSKAFTGDRDGGWLKILVTRVVSGVDSYTCPLPKQLHVKGCSSVSAVALCGGGLCSVAIIRAH